ncbi:MAG: biotin/lipoyl-binding protein [Alistipes sp.]|nr:biotin/lipoyl-binding protein [Alistipes sp.]
MKQRFSFVAFIVVVLAIAVLSIVGILTARHTVPPLQGTIEAREVRISGKLAGRVGDIYVAEGDRVVPGDTLIAIYSPETEALYNQAVALENAAMAQSDKVDGGARSEVIASARQLWQGAAAQRALAENTYHRVVRLWQDSVVSLQRKEEAEALYLSAKAAEGAAHEQYMLACSGAQREDRESARYMADAAAGGAGGVEALLHDAHLISPTEGVVVEIYPAEGELVGIGTPLLSIVVVDEPYAVFNVREDMMPHFWLGRIIRGAVPAIATTDIEWEVYYISPLGSYATWRTSHLAAGYDMRTFEVRARPVDNIEGLYPGMSVLVNMESIER